MDIPSLRLIHKRFPAAQIVTGLGNAAFLKRQRQRLPGAVELDWWESVALYGAHITATPARHFAARTRFGPAKRTGEQRSENTGSVNTLTPSKQSRKEL